MPVPGPRARAATVAAGWFVFAATLLVGIFGAFLLSLGFGVHPSAAVAGGVVLAVALAWWLRRSRRREVLAAPPTPPRDAPRPVPVPASAPDGVQACMRCGSTQLAIPGIRDGVWAGGGELQLLVCRDCNARSPPLTFERGEDYVAFVRGLHEEAAERP